MLVENILKILFLILINVMMIAGIILGYSNLFDISLFWALTTITSATELISQSISMFNQLMAQDPGFLFGIFFCFTVIVYDLKVFATWFNSFKITSEKKCASCQQRVYREKRQFLDRILSLAISVKRYRCVGCGKEYLISTKKAEEQRVPQNTATQKIIR